MIGFNIAHFIFHLHFLASSGRDSRGRYRRPRLRKLSRHRRIPRRDGKLRYRRFRSPDAEFIPFIGRNSNTTYIILFVDSIFVSKCKFEDERARVHRCGTSSVPIGPAKRVRVSRRSFAIQTRNALCGASILIGRAFRCLSADAIDVELHIMAIIDLRRCDFPAGFKRLSLRVAIMRIDVTIVLQDGR